MSSSNLTRQIAEVTKSKVSLTEAIHELELTKEAFTNINHISSQLQEHNSILQELKSRQEYFISLTFFNSKFEELAHTLDKSIKNRMDELSVSLLSQLNNKITIEEAENLFNKRVPWSNFTSLNQEVGILRTRVEKHILSDFEGLKTKIKLELASNLRPKKPQEQGTSEEIVKIKEKIANIEEQIQQLFDAGLDEDYDSKEELDNMMDDLERAVLKDKKSQDLSEMEGFVSDSVNLKPESLKVEEVVIGEIKIPGVMKIEDSPKNVASSRGDRSIVRRNSKTSSRASGIVGGSSTAIRNLSKKFDGVKKEIEDNKLEFLAFKNDTQRFDEEFAEIREQLNIIDQTMKDFEGKLEVMQASFLRALRRSGVPKEKPEKLEKHTKKLSIQASPKEFENISKEMDEKFKRVVRVETELIKVSSEFSLVKNFLKEKLKEVADGYSDCVRALNLLKKDVNLLKSKEAAAEKLIDQKLSEVKQEISHVKGPLTNIVSDQCRESFSLQEEIRRNQELVRSLLEDYNVRPNSQLSNRKPEVYKEITDKKSHSRVSSATPTLSSKHRYYKSNKNNEVLSIEENWLSYLPDGKPVCLPRVSYTVQKPEKPKTPETDLKKH